MKYGAKSAFVRKHPNLSAKAIIALAKSKGLDISEQTVHSTRAADRKSGRNGNGKPIPLVPTAKALADMAPLPAPTNGAAYPTEFDDIRTLRRMVSQQGFDRVLAIARTIQVCATETVGA